VCLCLALLLASAGLATGRFQDALAAGAAPEDFHGSAFPRQLDLELATPEDAARAFSLMEAE
jgi:hypothetical protein